MDLFESFRRLVAIPSPSWKEDEVAIYIKEKMADLCYSYDEDACGNLLFYRSKDRKRPLFSAHMDTVDKAVNARLIETEDSFSADGTALGADDKAAIAAMLKAAETADAFFLFTRAEEKGVEGSRHMTKEFLSSFPIGPAFIFDIEGPAGKVAVSAPGKATLCFTFHGRAAHAGFEIEKGRSALLAACSAALSIKTGQLDDDTTANIGSMNVSGSTNCVPDLASFTMEIRSLSQQRLQEAVNAAIKAAEKAAAEYGNTMEISVENSYHPYALPEGDQALEEAEAAAAAIGRKLIRERTFGGSDANNLRSLGLDAIVLSAGYENPHSADERISKKELTLVYQMILALAGSSR